MKLAIRIRIIAFLSLLLLAISSLHSQSAGDIDTLSQWRIEAYGVYTSGIYFDDFKYYISGTKVIESIEYYKVYKSGYWKEIWGQPIYYEHIYIGALREEGNVWYTYDYFKDTVLFDFNLEVGDTVISTVNYSDEIITVDSIITIQVDGEDKKQIYFTGEDTEESGYFIEDVGSATGLIREQLINWFEHHSRLHCFAIDFTPLWLNPEYPYCDLSVRIEEIDNSQSVAAYPNPFTATTTIEYELHEPSSIQLTIYNSIGEEVYKVEDRLLSVGKHGITWSADRLPDGMYYAVLRSEEGVSVVKMVKQ